MASWLKRYNIYYNGEEYWFTGNQSGTHFTLKDSAADDLDEQDSVHPESLVRL